MAVIRIPQGTAGGGPAPLPTGAFPTGGGAVGQQVERGFSRAAQGVEDRARQDYLQDVRIDAAQKRLLAGAGAGEKDDDDTQRSLERADRQISAALQREYENRVRLYVAQTLDPDNTEPPLSQEEFQKGLDEIRGEYQDLNVARMRSEQGRNDATLHWQLVGQDEAARELRAEQYRRYTMGQADEAAALGVDAVVRMGTPITPDDEFDAGEANLRLDAVAASGDPMLTDEATVNMLSLWRGDLYNAGPEYGQQFDRWLYDNQEELDRRLTNGEDKERLGRLVEKGVQDLKRFADELVRLDISDEDVQRAASNHMAGRPPELAELAYKAQAARAAESLEWLVERELIGEEAARAAMLTITQGLAMFLDVKSRVGGVVGALADPEAKVRFDAQTQSDFTLAWPGLRERLDDPSTTTGERGGVLRAVLETYGAMPIEAANYMRSLETSDENVVMLAALLAPYVGPNREQPQVTKVEGGLHVMKDAMPEDMWRMVSMTASLMMDGKSPDEAVALARADLERRSDPDQEQRSEVRAALGEQARGAVGKQLGPNNVVNQVEERTGVELDIESAGHEDLILRVISVAEAEMAVDPNLPAKNALSQALATVLSSYEVMDFGEDGKELHYLPPNIVPGIDQELVWDDVLSKLRGMGMTGITRERVRFVPVVNPDSPFDTSTFRWLIAVTNDEGASNWAADENGPISYTPNWEDSASAMREQVAGSILFMEQSEGITPTAVRQFGNEEILQLQADFFGVRQTRRDPNTADWAYRLETTRNQIAGGYITRDQDYMDFQQKVYERAYADLSAGGQYTFTDAPERSREWYAKRAGEAAAWLKFTRGLPEDEIEALVFAERGVGVAGLTSYVSTEDFNVEHMSRELKRLQAKVARETIDEGVRRLKSMYGEVMRVGE